MGPRPTTGAASGGQKGAGEGGKDDVKRASRSKSRFSAKKNGLKSKAERFSPAILEMGLKSRVQT